MSATKRLGLSGDRKNAPKRGRGRPPVPAKEKKVYRLLMRLSSKQRSAICATAERAGLSWAAWARMVLLAAVARRAPRASQRR